MDSIILTNENKLVARLCCQVAAWVTDMFCSFYLAKSHKIVNISATAKAREKISSFLILRQLEILDVCLTKFESYQILLNKISNKFLMIAKLFSG